MILLLGRRPGLDLIGGQKVTGNDLIGWQKVTVNALLPGLALMGYFGGQENLYEDINQTRSDLRNNLDLHRNL